MSRADGQSPSPSLPSLHPNQGQTTCQYFYSPEPNETGHHLSSNPPQAVGQTWERGKDLKRGKEKGKEPEERGGDKKKEEKEEDGSGEEEEGWGWAAGR